MASTTDEQPAGANSQENIPKGCVFIINNITGCNKDVERFSKLFQSTGFIIANLPEMNSYNELMEILSGYAKNKYRTVIVFFFGYGYERYIFMGHMNNELISFKTFCDAFSVCREKRSPIVVFTHSCFKVRASRAAIKDNADDIVENIFHYCARVNGLCQTGSLVADAVILQLNRDGGEQEFYPFTCDINKRISESQKGNEDQYYTDSRLYGVDTPFYFSSPAKKVNGLERSTSEQKPIEDSDVQQATEALSTVNI